MSKPTPLDRNAINIVNKAVALSNSEPDKKEKPQFQSENFLDIHRLNHSFELYLICFL